jgi:type II secretory ATPase GspE/PulE/Tfp pilus assembly ATPase PilB-like protein
LIHDIHRKPALDPVSGGIDENDSSIVRPTNQVIANDDRLGVSDIHIEPLWEPSRRAVRRRIHSACLT